MTPPVSHPGIGQATPEVNWRDTTKNVFTEGVGDLQVETHRAKTLLCVLLVYIPKASPHDACRFQRLRATQPEIAIAERCGLGF